MAQQLCCKHQSALHVMNEFRSTTHEMLNKKNWTTSRLAQNHPGRLQHPSNLLCLACRLSTSRQSLIYCTVIFSVGKCFAAHFQKSCCNDCIVPWQNQLCDSIQCAGLPESTNTHFWNAYNVPWNCFSQVPAASVVTLYPEWTISFFFLDFH